ncbi:MAG: DUF3868 domain-containing protein [Muribaculaceae bacterium]
MKTKLIYTIACLLFTFSVTAKQQHYKGEITITHQVLEQVGDSLHIGFDLSMNNLKIDSKHSIDYTPVIASPTKVIYLPKISIKGHNNHKSYLRSLELMTKKQRENYNAPYAVCKGYSKKEDQLNYTYTISYESWMSDAHLDIKKDDCGCGILKSIDTQPLVSHVSMQKNYEITPNIAYVQPEKDTIKNRSVQHEVYLDFAVGKTKISKDFANNAKELDNILKMVDNIKNDGNIKICQIQITGFASPEGSLARNRHISEGRAKALQNYLFSHYNLPKSTYCTLFGGEDWNGLEEAITGSDIRYKSQILDIITNTSVENGRETKLMRLKGGVPYKEMLKNIFPTLRRVECKIEYNIAQFNVVEGKEIFKTKPQNLSEEEMFQVANTYEKGSKEFNNVIETAVNIYPNSKVANLNAATYAISQKDVATAEQYIRKGTVNVPQYDNSMGLLLLLKGDYDKAGQYFQSAAQAGLPEASENLKELNKAIKHIHGKR